LKLKKLEKLEKAESFSLSSNVELALRTGLKIDQSIGIKTGNARRVYLPFFTQKHASFFKGIGSALRGGLDNQSVHEKKKAT
jgi:hypothetical protein